MRYLPICSPQSVTKCFEVTLFLHTLASQVMQVNGLDGPYKKLMRYVCSVVMITGRLKSSGHCGHLAIVVERMRCPPFSLAFCELRKFYWKA